jgi:hypothetical protein
VGDYEQSVQTGVGIGLGLSLETGEAETQLSFFPAEIGFRSKFQRSSLFNRFSPEYRLSLGNGEREHFFGIRYGIGKMIWSDLTSYGLDMRFGVNEKAKPVAALGLHLSDSRRPFAPGFFLEIELGVGEEPSLVTGLRWAIPWKP